MTNVLGHGSGCYRCNRSLSAKEVVFTLAKKKVKLLSKFAGINKTGKFQCCYGHVWFTTIRQVLYSKKNGCIKCSAQSSSARKTLTKKEVQSRLRSLKINTRSKYFGHRSYGVFKCVNRHKWRTTFGSILSGHKCPSCVTSKNRMKFKLTQKSINKRLSKKNVTLVGGYLGLCKVTKFKCLKCKHTWDSEFRSASDYGCPKCRPQHHTSVAESSARKVIERLTGWKFPPVKPKFLRGLTLDGYNWRHQVAFEFQGPLHYEPIYGKEALKRKKLVDERKRIMCLRHGVRLIIIPHWTKSIPLLLKKKLCQH